MNVRTREVSKKRPVDIHVGSLYLHHFFLSTRHKRASGFCYLIVSIKIKPGAVYRKKERKREGNERILEYFLGDDYLDTR